MSTSIPYYVLGYILIKKIVEVSARDSDEAMRIAEEENEDFIPTKATCWIPEGDDE